MAPDVTVATHQGAGRRVIDMLCATRWSVRAAGRHAIARLPLHPRMALGIAVAAAIAGGVLGLRAPAAPSGPASPPPATAADGGRLALDSLDRRIAQIERLLGDGTVAGLDAPSRVASDYNTLRARVEALGARTDASWSHTPTLMPVPGGTVTSPYTEHRFHPIRHRDQPHFGIDIGAPYGTPIRATADGLVVATANSATYGLGVDVDHGNGFITRYAHASSIVARVGQAVRRGDVIAYVGSTGLSTGPHCHYEVFHNGWSVDPMQYLLDAGLRVDASATGARDQ